MNPPGWRALRIEDPEPERVISGFEAARQGLPCRTFRLAPNFGLYDVRNRDDIVQFNRWMLERLRDATPAAGFLHVVDPDQHHPGWRYQPHTALDPRISEDRWWGFVPYLLGAVWHVPLLPDGDSYDFISSALDFAFESRWSFQGDHRIAFIGEPLVSALSGRLPNLLERFIEVDEPE